MEIQEGRGREEWRECTYSAVEETVVRGGRERIAAGVQLWQNCWWVGGFVRGEEGQGGGGDGGGEGEKGRR